MTKLSGIRVVGKLSLVIAGVMAVGCLGPAAHGSAPSRVQGGSCETGTTSCTVTLNSVASGDVLVASGSGIQGVSTDTVTFSDNCGGTWTLVDSISGTAASNDPVAAGYSTGSRGNCTITISSGTTPAATTGIVEEITAGTLDVHTINGNQSVAANGSINASVPTTAVDYVFSYAGSADGAGGGVTPSSPFTEQDSNNVFPWADADATQSSSGSITATWTWNASESHAAVGVIAFEAGSGGETSGKWVQGYYASWEEPEYPVNRIDWSALSAITLAHWLTNSNGTLQTSDWDGGGCTALVTAAHANGVKVIMMLGGSDDGNFASAASPTNVSNLVISIASEVSVCNLDGVDLDWETSINATNFINLASAIHTAHPGYIITAPIDPTQDPAGTTAAAMAASLSAYCAHVSMMTYGNANRGSGIVSAYFFDQAGDATNHPWSIVKYVTSWLGAGVPASKLVEGIGFYSVVWNGVTGAGANTASGVSILSGETPYGWSIAEGGGVLSCYYNLSGGTYGYDPSPALNPAPPQVNPPQQPQISSSSGITNSTCSSSAANWVTFEDEASIAAKMAYVNSQNLGGVIIWLLNEGATDANTGRNPLLDQVNLKLNDNGVLPLPQIGFARATNVGGTLPNIIPITGLSPNLQMVVVKWWNESSSAAFDPHSDSQTTYGQPSEYYLEASTNGTTWVQLAHITGEHYTGRQFEYDFTGTGYTQVRMRVISIVGSNNGHDDLTVNGSSTAYDSNDTYFLYGDSITANCWAVATNAGDQNNGVEQLGTQVNAIRPNRFPVATVGGQGGWDTAATLSTTTYGIPNIQQFLNDLPSVKYVGLSLGTNDADEGVSSTTYCSNMQSIVQYIIQAGKVPMIPTIVGSPSGNVQANAPAMNACLASLEQNYPSIIVGPDLWTLFNGHSTTDGWFYDDLHPSLGTGCTALQNAWVQSLKTTVYPH